MKKIKVIDLYNKIANGEIPEKIKFIGKIWEYDDSINNYSYFLIDHYEFFLNNISFSYINNEVEIIEDTPKEDKKITKLDNNIAFYEGIYQTCWNDREVLLVSKINEIIDKVNGEDND